MGYDRNDRRFERDYRTNTDRANYDRGYDNPNDRGFFDRAGDEVRSWFGDEEAERRRRYDEMMDERYDRETNRDRNRYDTGRYDANRDANRDSGRFAGSRYAPGGYTGPDRYPSWARSNRDEGHRDYANRGFSDNYRYGNQDDFRDRESEYRAAYGRDAGRGQQNDPHGYHDWRNRQIDSFDRDYDEYRREHQQRFENEFGTWRQTRQTQRDSLKQAQEHQEVLGSDGQHVGTVDHVRGDQILLTKTDKDAGGHHHRIPSSWISKVDDKVHLSKTADEAKHAWRQADETGGLFGGDKDRNADNGRTDLNRSFAGTYDRS